MEIPRGCPIPKICEMHLQNSDDVRNMTTEPFVETLVKQLALVSVELANASGIAICSVENKGVCPMMDVVISRYELMQPGNN